MKKRDSIDGYNDMQNIKIHHEGPDDDDQMTMTMEMKFRRISNMYRRLEKKISDRLCVSALQQ